MIPKIVHHTTKSGQLDIYEQRLLAKNKKTLKGWEFNIWSDEDNRMLVQRDFSEFLNVYDSISKGVAKSDIARCMYMYSIGGIYFDTDYEIQRPIPDTYLSQKCVLPVAKIVDGDIYLGNCVFLSEPGHRFWLDYIRDVFKNIDELTALEENRIIDVTGPGGITKFYLEHRGDYSDIIFPEQTIFHPNVIDHGLRVRSTKDTLGVHYCWGSWRSKKAYRKLISKLIRNLQLTGLIFK